MDLGDNVNLIVFLAWNLLIQDKLYFLIILTQNFGLFLVHFDLFQELLTGLAN